MIKLVFAISTLSPAVFPAYSIAIFIKEKNLSHTFIRTESAIVSKNNVSSLFFFSYLAFNRIYSNFNSSGGMFLYMSICELNFSNSFLRFSSYKNRFKKFIRLCLILFIYYHFLQYIKIFLQFDWLGFVHSSIFSVSFSSLTFNSFMSSTTYSASRISPILLLSLCAI